MQTITIHNVETGEVTTREMNVAELAQWEADQAKFAAEIKAKADADKARKALLDRLGITADEAKLLLS